MLLILGRRAGGEGAMRLEISIVMMMVVVVGVENASSFDVTRME